MWLIMIIWALVYSFSEPTFDQTKRNVDITGLSKGHISVLLEAGVTWFCTLVVPC